MSNFYIADTHFGHANIMRHSNRPFNSVDEMDEILIENWNTVVSNEDDVYVLGDFCYKSGMSPKYYLDRLNGKIHIILGNHDKVIRNIKHSKIVSISQYEDIMDSGYRVILFHYPMVEWNGFFRGSIHLYGHIHNNTENDTYSIMKNIKNAYNVGADILNYTPRKIVEIFAYNKIFNENH